MPLSCFYRDCYLLFWPTNIFSRYSSWQMKLYFVSQYIVPSTVYDTHMHTHIHARTHAQMAASEAEFETLKNEVRMRGKKECGRINMAMLSSEGILGEKPKQEEVAGTQWHIKLIALLGREMDAWTSCRDSKTGPLLFPCSTNSHDRATAPAAPPSSGTPSGCALAVWGGWEGRGGSAHGEVAMETSPTYACTCCEYLSHMSSVNLPNTCTCNLDTFKTRTRRCVDFFPSYSLGG